MNMIAIDGIERDISHLRRLIVVAEGRGKDGADLRVAVQMGLHAISRACGDGEVSNMFDENRKPRIFCEDRYAFSLGLPEIARRMIEQDYFCWESRDRNRAVNYCVMDVAPGRIRALVDGEHQVIFFYLYPSKVEDADVCLIITSCHSRHMKLSGVKRRYGMSNLLRK